MAPYGPGLGRRVAAQSGVLIPIAPILAHYGIELNAGRWGEEQVCCPVHGDRRPSMRVNAEKGLFFCHSCGAKGSAINLIMLMESVDREDARERADAILRAAGVEIKRGRNLGRYQRPASGGEAVPASGRRYVPPGRR